MSCGCASTLVAQIEYVFTTRSSLPTALQAITCICITHNYSTELHLSQATPPSSLHKKNPPKYPHVTALWLSSHQYFWITAEEMQLEYLRMLKTWMQERMEKSNCIPLKCVLCCIIRFNRKPKTHFWKRIFLLGFISSFSDSNLFCLEE